MRFVVIAFLLIGCTSQFAALRNGRDAPINELRREVADLRHAVQSSETEVRILEDRLEFSERDPPRSDEIMELKKKITALEKTIDKMNSDIHSLRNYAHQTTTSLETYKEQITTIDYKLSEIAKLRATLSKFSDLHHSPTTYQVQPGDSLQKIARKYQISLDSLKQANHLSSDKIIVGQKLSIPQ